MDCWNYLVIIVIISIIVIVIIVVVITSIILSPLSLSSSASHRDNFADRSAVGEVAENCKDDNAGEDRGERVAEADDESVPVENIKRNLEDLIGEGFSLLITIHQFII